ncbi:MAG: translocation/assembly module TamB domain-containing protein, partial [Spirochaetales bacterium]
AAPIALALIALSLLYLVRWSLLEGPVRSAVDRSLENAIGNDIEIEVGEIRGPLFTGLRISDIETIHPATSGLVRGVNLESVELNYRLIELIPLIAAAIAPDVPVAGSDPEWLFEADLDLARVAANLHEVWPRRTSLRASGELLLRAQSGWLRPEMSVSLTGSDGDDVAALRVLIEELDRGVAIPNELELESVEAGVRLATKRITAGLSVNRGNLATVDASVESIETSAGSSASTAISSVGASAKAPGIDLDATATRERLDFTLTVEEDEPFVEQVLALVAPDLEAVVGSLTATLEANAGDGVDVSLVDTLVEQPTNAPLVADAQGSIKGAGWRIGAIELEEIETEFNWADNALIASGVDVKGELAGSMFDEQGEPSASIALEASEVRFDAADERLVLRGFGLSGGSARVQASGAIDLAGYEPTAWSEATGSIDGKLRVANPQRVVRILTAAGLLADSAPIVFEEDGTASVAFTVQAAESGFRARFEPSVRGATLGPVYVDSFDMSASVEQNTATVTELVAVAEGEAVRLIEPVEISWAADLFVLDQLGVRIGDALLSASAGIGPESFSAEADLDGLPISTISSLFDAVPEGDHGGSISARVSVSGTRAAPLATVQVTSTDLVVDGAPGEVLVEARQEASGIVLDELSVEIGELARARGAGTIPIVVSTEGVTATNLEGADLNLVAFVGLGRLLPDPDLEPWSNAVLRTEIDVEGEGGTASLLITELSTTGELPLAGVNPFRRIRVDASTESLLDSKVAIEGVVFGDSTEIATFAASVPAPTASGGELTGETAFDLPLGRLSHLIPGVSLLGGSVVGEVALGSGESVEASGELSINDALVKPAAGVPTISALNGRITFTERQATIEELFGRMGQEAIRVTGSVALPEIESSQSSLPVIDMSIEGEGVLLARTPDVVASGDIDVSIDSGPESVRVTGRFDATEVLYTAPVQLLSLGSDAETPGTGIELFYVDAEWARAVSLNIRVVADESIVVDNNLYEGELSADLRILGTAAVPRPDGRVFANDGVVTLPTATLTIEQLRVVFPPDSTLNPSIFARAQADAQGYEMLITVDGQFPNVEVDVASSPPLPTDQALVLLATGRQPSQLTFGGDGGALEAAGTVLGRSLISDLAGSASGDGGGFFERLQFDIERDAESDLIGNVEVEYQFAEGEPWYLLIERVQAEEYTVQLSWRLWAD